MGTEKKGFDRLLAIISLIISMVTVLVTSPLLQDYYIAPEELKVSASRIENENILKIKIDNVGRKKASGLIIELTNELKGSTGRTMVINNTLFFPPKEFLIVKQGMFKLIKVNDTILPKEVVTIYLRIQLDDKEWSHLWLRVRSNSKDYGEIRLEESIPREFRILGKIKFLGKEMPEIKMDTEELASEMQKLDKSKKRIIILK